MAGQDVVVIGAGISGLVDAILLAETGRRVLVLEQHTIPGGYLQQFHRKRTCFDVGFHYMGSTRPGRPMRQMLEHLQIWPRLRLLPFPEDAATFAAFRDKARRTWPAEAKALDGLLDHVDEVCGEFKWFALKKGREYRHPLDMDFGRSAFQEYLELAEANPAVARNAWQRLLDMVEYYGYEKPQNPTSPRRCASSPTPDRRHLAVPRPRSSSARRF